MIDIMDVKQAIKNGDLRVFTKRIVDTDVIYLEDVLSGECVKIGEVENDQTTI